METLRCLECSCPPPHAQSPRGLLRRGGSGQRGPSWGSHAVPRLHVTGDPSSACGASNPFFVQCSRRPAPRKAACARVCVRVSVRVCARGGPAAADEASRWERAWRKPWLLPARNGHGAVIPCAQSSASRALPAPGVLPARVLSSLCPRGHRPRPPLHSLRSSRSTGLTSPRQGPVLARAF